MIESETDLFGERVQLVKRPNAYASPPGSGPDGKTCRTCEHILRAAAGNATVSKCKLVDPYGGAATDINMHTAACRQYEPREGEMATCRVY